MFIEKLVRFFRIANTRQEPKLGKVLLIFQPQKRGGSLEDTIPPLTKARKVVSNLWYIQYMNNYSMFVWVE